MKKLIVALLVASLFSACRKDNTDNYDYNLITAEDDITARDLLEDNDEELDLQIGFREPTTCPAITYQYPQGTFPNTITIDYGTDGCAGPGGKTRRGKMLVQISDSISNAGATRTITFDNFSIDNVQVQGTRTITNNGQDPNGIWSLTRTATNMILTFPDGKTISWNGSYTAKFIEGYDTPTVRLDDVFEVSGGSQGVNRNNKSYTTTITTPFIKANTCAWVKSGIANITTENKILVVNYGNGTCDRIAIVTLPNGETREVQIKRWW
ncbi:MAG: hypothetical protein WAS72_06310 [Saprospiraceae bacterium]